MNDYDGNNRLVIADFQNRLRTTLTEFEFKSRFTLLSAIRTYSRNTFQKHF